MDRRRWLAAAFFGIMNVGLFVVAVPFIALVFFVGAPVFGALLVALAIVAAYWCLAAVDDLARVTGRDAAALLVRGGMSGALVAAIVGGGAFGLEGISNGLYGALLSGFVGLFVGLACAVVDLVVLGAVRFAIAARSSR